MGRHFNVTPAARLPAPSTAYQRPDPPRHTTRSHAGTPLVLNHRSTAPASAAADQGTRAARITSELARRLPGAPAGRRRD